MVNQVIELIDDNNDDDALVADSVGPRHFRVTFSHAILATQMMQIETIAAPQSPPQRCLGSVPKVVVLQIAFRCGTLK